MSVVKRCEIKQHEPHTGDKCPRCNNEQNAALFGLLISAGMLAFGIGSLILLFSKFK